MTPIRDRALRRVVVIPLLATVVVALVSCGGDGSLTPPGSLEMYGLLKVDRTVENQLAGRMVELWERRAFPDGVAAVYEYDAFPYKPVFFLGAARGRGLERRGLMAEAITLFGGLTGLDENPTDHREDGTSFLCAPFQTSGVVGTPHASGLAALSAICVWDDGRTVGFGVGVAGVDVRTVLEETAESRRALGG